MYSSGLVPRRSGATCEVNDMYGQFSLRTGVCPCLLTVWRTYIDLEKVDPVSACSLTYCCRDLAKPLASVMVYTRPTKAENSGARQTFHSA